MPSKKLDFKAGQYVVYPTQGVGKLLRIEEQTVAGQKIKMLVIDFERNHMTLRVPVERAEISGLRPLTSAKKMDEAIASAKGKAGAKRMIWARRAAQYEENINSGDPMKLAEVVRDLQRRSAADTMTFSARQLYLRALERMAQEFAVLHKVDLDTASDKIEDLNRLKVVLVEKKRTNKWLAEQLGKDPATVSKWCTNAAQPSLETLLQIAKCLEVEVKDLLNSQH